MVDVQIINQLAEILVKKYDRSTDFLQIMFVYRNVKPGFFPQFRDEPEVVPIFKKEVLPLLKELGFYVSFKHGGYVTLSHHLYKSWNGFGYHFNQKNFGPHYLGYPECCQISFNLFPDLLSFSLYYQLQKIINENDHSFSNNFKSFFDNFLEIEEYHPCVCNCHGTHNRAQKLRRVRGEFIRFMSGSYLVKKKIDVKDSCINLITSLNQSYLQKKFKKQLKLLKSHQMRELFHLDDDFFNVVEEFLADPHQKQKLLAEMEAYIKIM